MALSLDDIWDKDADFVTQPAESGPTPLFTEHTSIDEPLFHSASLDDDEDHTWSKPTEEASNHLQDVESMFDIPDEDLVVRHSSGDRGNTVPSSQPSSLHEAEIDPPILTLSKKEGNLKNGKNGRVIPKLDNERLLGKDGLPALIKEAKAFKISDRGHEPQDLTRLLYMYQLWSHKMYPKLQFKETVDKVEKLCHSKRLLISLSGYRDAEKEGTAVHSGTEVNSPTQSVRASSNDPEHDDDNTLATFDVTSNVEGGDRPIGEQNSLPQNHTGGSILDDDDMDIDALLNEFDEEARASSANDRLSKIEGDSLENEDMWDAMREYDQHDSWPSNHDHSEASNTLIIEGEAIKPLCIPHIAPTQESEDDLYIN